MKTLLTLAALLALPAFAQQVVLVPNLNIRCNSTSSYALSRIEIRPDGTVGSDMANEWVIPPGFQLQVTDFQYTYGASEPQWNFLDLFVLNRRTPGSSILLETAVHTGSSTWSTAYTPARISNISMPESQHRTFGTPYVFNGEARLCVGSPGIRFYSSIRIIGRLVAAPTVTTPTAPTAPTGGLSLSP